MSRPVALYRWYDAADQLLYVGISWILMERTVAHANTQPWWPEIALCRVEWFPTRREAAAAERRAIAEEKPRHNRLRPRQQLHTLERGYSNRSRMEYRFTELILGQSMDQFIGPRRAQGKSFDDISVDLTNYLRSRRRALGLPEDIKVSGETVRRWYGLPR